MRGGGTVRVDRRLRVMRLMLRTDKAPASYSQAHASGSTGWKLVLARHMSRSAQEYALDRVMLVIGQVLVLTLHGIIETD